LPKKIKKYRAKRKNEPEDDKENENEEPKSSGFFGKYARMPRRERTPEQKKEYKKLAAFLFGWCSFVAAVYILFVQIELNNLAYLDSAGAEPEFPMMGVVMLAYLILGAALFLVWLIFNGGFKKIDVSKYEKPEDMGYDEFCKFTDKLKERQRKSKYFLILFMPFIIVLLVDWWIIRLTTDRGAMQDIEKETEKIEEIAKIFISKFINLI